MADKDDLEVGTTVLVPGEVAEPSIPSRPDYCQVRIWGADDDGGGDVWVTLRRDMALSGRGVADLTVALVEQAKKHGLLPEDE